MNELQAILPPQAAAALLLTALRAAAMLMVAPVFSHPAVPVRLRLGMAVVLAIGLSARVPDAAVALTPAGLALAAAGEILAGALLGYLARLVFVGVQIGTFHVAQQMGLNLAESYSRHAPGGQLALLPLLGVALFLAIGGHRQLIQGLAMSLQSAPVGQWVRPAEAVEAAVSLLGVGMVVALKVAAPVLAALLLTGLAMGLLQRTAPQLHVISTNLPLRVLVGLAVLAAAVATLPYVVDWAWQQAVQQIRTLAAGGAA